MRTNSPCHRQHSNEVRSNGLSPWNPDAHIYKKNSKKKSKKKAALDLLKEVKSLRSQRKQAQTQIKALQSKIIFIEDKNKDLSYFLSQKEQELKAVREELDLCKAERTKILEERI
jgi:chromosome segregation ATPase